MKKSLLLITMVLTLIVLAGCGPQSNSDISSDTGSGYSALSIPNSDGQPEIKDNQTAKSQINVTEWVPQNVIKVKVDAYHSWRGDLQVEVFSPSGIKHVLRERTQQNKNDDTDDFVVTEDVTNVFGGSELNGLWTLEITDHGNGDEGILIEWKLEFLEQDNSSYNNNSYYPNGNNGYNDNSEPSIPACNGICSYGAQCSDFCPSTAYCSGAYTSGGQLYWTINGCGNNSYDSGYGSNGYDNGYGSNGYDSGNNNDDYYDGYSNNGSSNGWWW